MIELSGVQLFPKSDDNNTCKLQVVEVPHRRGECGKMVPCDTLACQVNAAVTLKDCLVSRFQELLDNVHSYEQNEIRFDITERDSLMREETEGEKCLAVLKRNSMNTRKKKRNPRHHALSTSTPTTVLAT
jgi:hypothetical protein